MSGNSNMDIESKTKLLNAIKMGDVSEAKTLIESGVDVNYVIPDSNNETPLHAAVISGNTEIARLLLAKGANRQAKNSEHKTPFELCTHLDGQQKIAMEAIFDVYTKRSGTAALGHLYEIKLLTMVLFRLLHDNRIEAFYLGTNLDEADSFDDVVFRTSIQGKSHVCCIQAKHRKVDCSMNYKDLFSGQDKNFDLKKYFRSFLKIRYMFRPDSEIKIFQEEYEKTDLQLIIFTSAKYEAQDEGDYELTNKESKMFTQESGKIYRIKSIQENLSSFEKCYKEVVLTILAKIIVLHKNEEYLEQDIKKILTEQGLRNSDDVLQLQSNSKIMETKINNNKLIEMIDDISNKLKLEDSFFPSNEEFAQIVSEFLQKLRLYSEQATEDQLDALVMSDIRSKNYERDDLIYSKSYSAVERYWKQHGQVPFLTNKCTFFKATTGELELESLHSIGTHNINPNSVYFDYKHIEKSAWVSIYRENLEENPFIMNVYSSTPSLSCIKLIQYFKRDGKEFKFVIIDNSNINHALEVSTRAKPKCLIVAYHSKTDKNTVDRIIESLKQIKNIIIVTKNGCGISRSIEDKTESLLDLEPSSQENILAKKVSFQGYEVPLKGIVGAAPKSLVNAETLVKLIYDKNIVLSVNMDGSLENFVERDLINSKYHVFNPLSESDVKVIVVAAAPGMGKSTFLTWFGREMKIKNPSSWILRINLSDHSDQFNEWLERNIELNKELAMSMLMGCSVQNQTDSFEIEIFRWYCEQRKLTLLIDGFDEISPDYTAKVLYLIKVFKEDFADKLWVTTRFGQVQSDLEKSLGVSTSTLKPLTKKQANLFLWNFWKRKLNLKQEQRKLFDDYVKKLWINLPQSKDLVSVPLQINMIANILQDDFKNFINDPDSSLKNKSLDVVSIYEKFIEHKCDIMIKDKLKIYTTMVGNKKRVHDMKEKIKKEHRLVAVLALFNDADTRKILSMEDISTANKTLQEVKTSEEKTGIIVQVAGGKPKFIHQTYAEFFVAQFLWERYATLKTEEFEKFSDEILIDCLIEDDRNQIAKLLKKIAKKYFYMCQEPTIKARLLLKTLLKSMNNDDMYLKIERDAFAFILGVVELSMLAEDEKNFEHLRGIVSDTTIDNDDVIILFLKSCKLGYISLVRFLTYNCTNMINDESIDGWTALHYAVYGGHLTIVDYLLQNSANVHSALPEWWEMTILGNYDYDYHFAGFTPLHFAAQKNYPEIIRLLTDKGANVDCTTTDNGRTPLFQATINRSLEAVKTLLDLGADVNLGRSDNGFTPLHCAAQKNYPEIIRLLTAKGANVDCTTTYKGRTPLFQASINGSLEAVKTLLDLGANVNLGTSDNGYTPLHCAAQNNYPEIIPLLTDKGANVNCTTTDEGRTPLFEASLGGSLEAVKTLLDLGADVNLGWKDIGYTPLHCAAFKNYPETIRLLIDKGADVDCTTTDNGRTPLHIATKEGNLESVRVLLELGANTDVTTNPDGSTPLSLAREGGFAEIEKLLSDRSAENNKS